MPREAWCVGCTFSTVGVVSICNMGGRQELDGLLPHTGPI